MTNDAFDFEDIIFVVFLFCFVDCRVYSYGLDQAMVPESTSIVTAIKLFALLEEIRDGVSFYYY